MSLPLLPLAPNDAAAELLRRRKARTSMLAFTTYTKPDYRTGWFHERLCEKLDLFTAGIIKRLMVFMPPQHGKSELVSRRLPAYIFGRNSAEKVIASSYTSDLAAAMTRDVQKIMDSASYRHLFPGTCLGGRNVRTVSGPMPLRNSEDFEVIDPEGRMTGGYYKSAGVGGGITGRPMDTGIIDDPVKGRENADSPAHRENVWGWYNGDFLSRAHGNTKILITSTRWHEDDLPGRLLRAAADDPKADQWEVVCYPAICEESRPGDPRQPGEALWPERHPLALLEAKRASSPYDWASLYQQRPRGAGTLEWPDEYFGPGIWFEDWPKDLFMTAMALDPSKGKSDKVGDYSSIVWGGLDKTANPTLWVDADLARRHVGKIVEDAIAIYRTFKPRGFGLEVNGFQELIGQPIKEAAREHAIILPLYGFNNTVAKVTRIRTLGSWLAQRRIRIRNSAGGRMLVQQLKDFPCGDHDDGPDGLEMMTRMLAFLLTGGTMADPPRLIA